MRAVHSTPQKGLLDADAYVKRFGNVFFAPQYWSPDAVSRINRKLLKNAGIEEHVRFHDLRHTFATMAISSGVDVKTLSSMLGHYSAGFTLDTYTHITNDMQRGAAEKIGGFMESATATTTPEPPDPPEESRCKVIPFERVG